MPQTLLKRGVSTSAGSQLLNHLESARKWVDAVDLPICQNRSALEHDLPETLSGLPGKKNVRKTGNLGCTQKQGEAGEKS